VIRRGSAAAPLPPLVKLADGDTRRPLFCVHSAPGDLMFLRILLRHVQFGRPVYGFRSVGLDRREAPLPTIPDMAIRYLEELRTVQPAGPYLLAGNCIGGLIAVEMAHRLVAAGERVAFLGLMDTTICQRSIDATVRAREAGVAGVRLATLREQLGELGVRRMPPGSEESSTEVPEFVQWLSEVSAKNACAALAYAVRPYPGPITLFTATLGPLDPEELEEEWTSMAEGGLSVIPIEVEHDDIGDSPALGHSLKECLDRVDPLPSSPDPGGASA
jgi:thioesterase domain-containing protein